MNELVAVHSGIIHSKITLETDLRYTNVQKIGVNKILKRYINIYINATLLKIRE